MFEISHVPGEQTFSANLLSMLVSSKRTGYNHMLIQETFVITSIEAGKTNIIKVAHLDNRMMLIIHYMQSDELPQE